MIPLCHQTSKNRYMSLGAYPTAIRRSSITDKQSMQCGPLVCCLCVCDLHTEVLRRKGMELKISDQ